MNKTAGEGDTLGDRAPTLHCTQFDTVVETFWTSMIRTLSGDKANWPAASADGSIDATM